LKFARLTHAASHAVSQQLGSRKQTAASQEGSLHPGAAVASLQLFSPPPESGAMQMARAASAHR